MHSKFNCQVKFSELTLDMYRMLLLVEYNIDEQNSQVSAKQPKQERIISKFTIYLFIYLFRLPHSKPLNLRGLLVFLSSFYVLFNYLDGDHSPRTET